VTAAWVAEQRDEAPEALGEGLVAAYDRLFVRGPRREALGERRARSTDPRSPKEGGS
jgi:hypothetical protein